MSSSRPNVLACLSPLVFALGGIVATVAACAGGDDPIATARDATDPDGGAAATDASTTTGVDAGADAGKAKKDGGQTAPEEPEEPKTDAECASLTTQQGCFICCSQYHKPGYATYDTALRGCACGASGQCAKECAGTACQGPNVTPDAACRACLEKVMTPNTGACVQPVTAACAPNADCVAMYTCSTTCPGP